MQKHNAKFKSDLKVRCYAFCFALAALSTLSTPLAALAASDQFTISQTVVDVDTSAPTAPANLSATAVATTQIDLAWDAATDDVAVAGYQIFRDGVQIATSTATSYSDVGLAEQTLYAYVVTAFDASGNVSASSTPASATTFSPSAPPSATSTPGGGGNGHAGDNVPPRLIALAVAPTTRAAAISWETNVYVKGTLQWGTTPSYELGSSAEAAFATGHATVITDLEPDTTYDFAIVAETPYSQPFVLVRSSFHTNALPDTMPPTNVSQFTATESGNDDIRLSWRNPSEPDFTRVRIVRSNEFFPTDPSDGYVVYDGKGQSKLDAGAAAAGGTVYYAAFAYDENGNVSSGAVAYVLISGTSPFEQQPEVEPLIKLSDVTFFQDGVQVPERDGRIRIDASRQLTAVIAYDALPERLKTITVTLADPSDPSKIFSFLLRVNKEKTAYLATLAPLGRAGQYPLSVSLFDFERKALTTVHGELEATLPQSLDERHSFLSALAAIDPYLFWFILVLLLLIAHRLIRAGRRT